MVVRENCLLRLPQSASWRQLARALFHHFGEHPAVIGTPFSLLRSRLGEHGVDDDIGRMHALKKNN